MTRSADPHRARSLHLQTLGAVALMGRDAEGGLVPVLGPGKPLALLTYLALSPGRAANREHLIDLLWSDLEPERGRHALRQTVYFLRSQLGEDALGGKPGELIVNVPITVDRDVFLAAVEEGDLERAVGLYTGSFLPGFAAPGGAEFEHWADVERERLRVIFVRTAESLARKHLGTSSFREAQRLARRARDEDPLNESNWRLLIETLVAAGDQLAAAIEADALTTLLEREGRTAEPATRAAMRLARQRHESHEPEERGRGLTTELVGREAEFAAVIRAWEAARNGHPRHVHVSAPAGLGKTRLLNDVHGRLRAGGVRVVNLRANPGDRRIAYLLAGEIAGALGTLPGAAAISPAAASALVALHPALSSNFVAAMDQSVGDEALRRRTMALSELAAAVSDESPLALLIDDVHWADPASAQTLLGLLERLGTSRVLVVTTARSAREDLFAASAAERLTLEPLTAPQVRVLLASLGRLPSEDWTDAFVAALHGTTGGSPLLVLETLQLALDRGSLQLHDGHWCCGDPVFLITELQAGGALRHRITQLAPESRDLLVLLATAGAPLSLARVARAAGQTAEETETHLSALERRGVVVRIRNDWEPAHDQIAEIAVESAPLATLVAAHGALGRVLASDAEFDHRLYPRAAHHLAAANDTAELERLFAEWVELARSRGDHRPAAQLATDLLGGDADNARIRRLVQSVPLSRRADAFSWRAAAAAAALLFIAGTITVSALGGMPEAAEPPVVELFAVTPGGADSARILRASLEPRAFASAAPLVLGEDGRGRSFGAWSRVVGAPELSPDGRRWAFARATGDSGVVDLYVASGTGRAVRLTVARGEDESPSWAPDAERLAFVTHRWASTASQDGDVAILEIPARRVRRLTRTPADDYSPRWSPDGTRIAFARRTDAGGTPELCWTSADGSRERCHLVQFEIVQLLGWQGTSHVLAMADAAREQVIVRIPVDGGSPDVLVRAPMVQAAASPNGVWLACLCQRAGDAAPEWYAFAASSPQIARRVQLGDTGTAPLLLGWGSEPGQARYIAEFRIQRPERPIAADATYRLRWTAFDTAGQSVALPAPVLGWRSGDTAVAEVDSVRGVVRPRGVGTVAIWATAGGWRSDSITLTIGAPGAHPVLVESWEEREMRNWRGYGEPKPVVAAGPGGVRGFNVAGDGSFASGAYSVSEFTASDGLGLETTLSTPTDRPRLQGIVIALTAALEDGALEGWDHLTGFPPGSRAEPLRSCSVASRGAANGNRLTLTAAGTSSRARAPELASPDGWYTVRLQVFPDGTCGVAVNGQAVWRSEASLPTDARYRVHLSGNSAGARLLVGPVEVWQGIRGGVDWTVLE